jgi:hypothetical protein
MIPELRLSAQNKYTFSQFADETVDFAKQPMNWKGEDYLRMGIITAATISLMFADQPVRDEVLKDREYFNSVPIEFGRIWGDLPSPIVLFSGFAAYSLFTGDDWTRKVAYEIGQASLYAGGITFLLKFIIGRARPYMEEGSASYHPCSSVFVQDYHSIPGGHAAAAFTISTVLSRNVKPVWLKVLFYMPAGLTVVSRVYQDKHWLSDCFLEAALGYFVATWVVDIHEKADKKYNSELQKSMMDGTPHQPFSLGNLYGINLMERVQLQPFYMGDYYGINLCISVL